MSALRAHYEPTLIDSMMVCVTVPVYRVSYRGTDIAVYCTTMGGPATVGLMEMMISKGCEKFVCFGSCGVLDRGISAKSLIVPTAAYRDEGTSYHYLPVSDYIEVSTAPQLSALLTELQVPHVCGKTWTTDAFFRETRERAQRRKREGCLTVEMECASIMAAAQFRGVEAYQFLYAADSLDGIEWDARTLGRLPLEASEAFLRIALEVAAKVSVTPPKAAIG
jgi:uridine phosphorylase